MELASEDSFDADDFAENPTAMAKDSQSKKKYKRSDASRQVFQVAKDHESGVVFSSR